MTEFTDAARTWLKEEAEIRDSVGILADAAMESSLDRFAGAMALMDVTFRDPFVSEDADDLRKVLLGIQLHAHHNLFAGWYLLRAGFADAAAMHLRTAIESPFYLRAARDDELFALEWDKGFGKITTAWKVIRRVEGRDAVKELLDGVSPIHKAIQQYSHVSARVAAIGAPVLPGGGRLIAPSGYIHADTTSDLASRLAAGAVILLLEVQVICDKIDSDWDRRSAAFIANAASHEGAP